MKREKIGGEIGKEKKNECMKTREEVRMCLQTIRALDASTDNYVYVSDLLNNRVYFTDKIREKFPFPPVGDDGNSIDEWRNIVYIKDRKILQENCCAIKNGEKKIYNIEYRLIDRKGNKVWVSCRGSALEDENGEPNILIGCISELAIGHMIDNLTGLRNGDKFMEEFDQCLKENNGYLMVVGVDDFKNINIRKGRAFGDYILKTITDVLEQYSAYSFNLYRLDGDRFAVNFVQQQKEDVLQFYLSVKKALNKLCTISAGVVAYQSNDDIDGRMVYQYAENAMDQAKREGKNMLVFFSLDNYQKDLEQIELLDEIKAAIQNDCRGFYLCYQPQTNSQNFDIYGVETLLRYDSPSRGKMSPVEFIPLLEKSGLICPVGEWALRTALFQCKKWREKIPNFHISVNLSYVQLQQKDIVDTVLNLLKDAELPGNALTLEVTESIQLQDYIYFNKIFYAWKQYGIKISIDDFGTGYSSLSYLKRIEIDEVKIDKCFVDHVQHDTYNYRLLSNIIELAHSAEIKVCCEGVETFEELMALQELNTDFLQGYLFAKPYTKEEFEQIYICTESKAYQERKLKESNFRHMESSESRQFFEKLKKEEIGNIIENMDELVYISDIDTHELYYMNAVGRQMTGLYDYKCCKCYEVFRGKDTPCEFCTDGLLCEKKFYVWESKNLFLDRHFIVKEKLIPWQEKLVRLGIGIDITERQIVSQSIQKKLNFEEAIVESCKLISSESDPKKFSYGVLKIMGEFCQSDRAYILKPKKEEGSWSIFREWSAEDIDSVKEFFPIELDQVPPYNNKQMITAPIMRNNHLLGLVCVDNPNYTKERKNFVETIAYFLGYSMIEELTQERLNDLFRFHHYEDILNNTDLGLWMLCIDPNNDQYRLYGDQVWHRIMEIDINLSPEERYKYWFDRVGDGYHHYVKREIEHMIHIKKIIQMEYTWNFPSRGETTFQCTGVRAEDRDGIICLEGYIRIVNNVERSRILPKGIVWEEFEYNEKKKSIYFHTERKLLAGDHKKEENFPECWIEGEIVHPHYAEKIRSIFSSVQVKDELRDQEIVLKASNDTYEWFKLSTKRIGKDPQDIHTILVVIEPTDSERAMKLGYMRKMEFYEAMLSETVAYAEIDVESGYLTRAGGLWADNGSEDQMKPEKFEQVIKKKIKTVIYPEDENEYRKHLDLRYMRHLYEQGEYTNKYCFRRLVDKKMCWMELVTHIFQNQHTGNIYALLYLRNVDAEKRRELAQEAAAKMDSLTNVYNRRTFKYEVVQFMTTEEKNPNGALILLDLDNFKMINDTFGHLKGDEALKMLTKILKHTFRRDDIIGRIGGDEFLVFVKGITDKEVLDQRMIELFKQFKKADGLPLSCSAGISWVHGKDFSYSDVLDKADIALYRSKKKGKNQYCYY